MNELAPGYEYHIDDVSEAAWYETLGQFEDANIYQTWAYGKVRRGESNTSRLILKKNGRLVACAQSLLARLPLSGGKAVAFVRWGPLWQRVGFERDTEIFRQALRAIKVEYTLGRGYLVRLFPILYDNEPEPFRTILSEEGFSATPGHKPQRTLLLDLTPSMEDLRKGFKHKWRNSLNRAERKEHTVLEGVSDELFTEFLLAYGEMCGRKKLRSTTEVEEFRFIQHDLPDPYKMRIMVAKMSDELSAAAICSGIGNTGIYLLGATTNPGMKTKGSFILQWKMLEWLKSVDVGSYNLNGINPETNPGTYTFKAGLAGKEPVDVSYLGQYDNCKNNFEKLLYRVVEWIWRGYLKWKFSIRRFLKKSY